MNKYELCVVVSAKVEDEQRTATVDKCKEYITRFGGTITDVEDCGKKKLAYEINDQKEGYYLQFNFSAESTFPKEIERKLKITENVMRYLVVRVGE